MTWVSPVTGRSLVPDTSHSLSDGGERWPVVDGIPYLRTGRATLVAEALSALDAGDKDAALVLLLVDQDDWWTGPMPDEADLRKMVRERGHLTLREAMALLAWGPVADYFAYRWVDPTFLAGLALLEAHWREPATSFELACGIGHYARELTRRGVKCLGADVVFAKCWLAKHWVAPEAEFACFDAADTWPVAGQEFDLVHCQDAFYFFPEQERVAARLREAVAPGGVLAVGHLHNSEYREGAKGPARSVDDWSKLFPSAAVYDERHLLWCLLKKLIPEDEGWCDDPGIEAWSIAESDHKPGRLEAGLTVPPSETTLQSNPLLRDGVISWPSERWREEYGAACWWAHPKGILGFKFDPIRTRRLVDLPERW